MNMLLTGDTMEIGEMLICNEDNSKWVVVYTNTNEPELPIISVVPVADIEIAKQYVNMGQMLVRPYFQIEDFPIMKNITGPDWHNWDYCYELDADKYKNLFRPVLTIKFLKEGAKNES